MSYINCIFIPRLKKRTWSMDYLNHVIVSKPCLTEKNQCSHLCLKHGNDSMKCDCPTGMQLINETNCTIAERDFEIYFADSSKKKIYHILRYKHQDGLQVKTLPFPSSISYRAFPLSLDVHLKSRFIYWADNKTHKVW